MLRLLLCLIVCLPTPLKGYQTYNNCHSHNDYQREYPFYEAFIEGFASIEADVFLVEGELYVAHDRENISPERTLRRMYLEPVNREMILGKGSCYGNGRSPQLLIDLKTDYRETLPVLVRMLEKYRECFDTQANPSAVKVIVSGNMPPPEEFESYSSLLFFDGRPGVDYSAGQLQRLAMVSASYSDFSKWSGKGRISAKDIEKITAFIDMAHGMGLKARFWGCPDNPEAWGKFIELGLDFINTDRPAELAAFLETIDGH